MIDAGTSGWSYRHWEGVLYRGSGWTTTWAAIGPWSSTPATIDSRGSERALLLVRLSPRFDIDLPRLDYVLAHVVPGLQVAVEVRHPSRYQDATFALLERRGGPIARSTPLRPCRRAAG
jgi:uncharacterized protein YecE (DUF72 family)